MRKLMERCLGIQPWKKDWQDDLTRTLSDTQKGLGVSMVVVIARESDLYAELLYLLSFGGLIVGVGVASWMRARWGVSPDHAILPLLGFALGSTLFAFRRFFLNRVAPRAIRERVSGRAKALFYDHYQQLKGRLVLLYLSEMEREALFVTSPDLTDKTPAKEIRRALSELISHYSQKNPMESLRPALLSLGELLRAHYGSAEGDAPVQVHPVYLGASDRASQAPVVPILKGSKEIN